MTLPTLKRGSRGPEVKELQVALCLIVDGIFGPITEEAVKDYQQSHGLVADGIVGPATWKSLLAVFGYNPNRDLSDNIFSITHVPSRVIDEIILHCTATPEGIDYTVEQVRDWHVRGNGWSDIGYHFLIGLDGTIHVGRDIEKIGAHCTGHNSRSIGISYVGGCTSDGHTPKDTRTPQQREAIKNLIYYFRTLIPGITVHCHNEFANKACPSFTIHQL